jgi:tRNA threonylcarbamoyladenosine biosynthesis protein TsaE
MRAVGADVAEPAAPAASRARELDLAGLAREGARIWSESAPGQVVWLSGDLGAGKTTLVQAIVAAAGAGRARSPTFALVHHYESGSGTLAHVDCYRLRRPEEAEDLDLAALARTSRLTLIEWPERAGPFAPRPDRHVRLSYGSTPDLRVIEILT